MKRLLFVLLFAFSFTVSLQAQNQCEGQADWRTPQIHHFDDPSLETESAVIIKDHRTIEYEIGYNQASQFYTIHKIIRVNDDAGIEMFNKVYIPLHGNAQVLDLEVRTISPEGKVTRFNKSNLRQLHNVDGYGNYEIFAVEGIVKGGEIEYTYKLKKNVVPFGREVYQNDVPVLSAKFNLISPKNYKFISKSYNGFPKSKKSTDRKSTGIVSKELNVLKIRARDIPALPKEEYSSTKSILMRVDYKLDSTPAESNIYNWSSIAKSFTNTIYTSKGSARASKFIKNLNLEGKTEFDKIVLLEKKIKETFSLQESNNEEYSNTSYVFKNHVGNQLGLIRAYMQCFEKLNVRFFIIASASRFYNGIDPKFAHSMDTREIFFYFPQHKKYIMPTHNYMRFGPATSVYAGNNGLFIRAKPDQYSSKILFGESFVQKIQSMTAEENQLGIQAELTLQENLDEMFVKLKYQNQGYRAYIYRDIINNVNEEGLEKFKKKAILSAIDDPEISSFSLENEDTGYSINNDIPLIVNLEFTANSLLDQAGQDLIIPIGKIIGKQSELYEEKDRTTDVIIQNKKMYRHELKLNIPPGYECTGLDNLKISNAVIKEGEKIMRFDSNYTLEDNVLTITIQEDYHVLHLEKEFYNDYRDVINSAADFNKVVLVLVPKEEKVN